MTERSPTEIIHGIIEEQEERELILMIEEQRERQRKQEATLPESVALKIRLMCRDGVELSNLKSLCDQF
ncbi:hypothetical protein CWJ60_004523 [Escherichia coli]|nr:hypothetical protein [Escherichia coli]